VSVEPFALLLSGMAAGLVAGTASCTAVQGGLLVGLTSGSRQARDPLLVAWFLAGRLASYSLAGALLGLVGSAVALPPEVRALLLVGAGVAVIAYAIRLLRRPHDGCETPRRETRSAPLLGAATILIPCGVTIGMELVAISSGSPVGGAAVMAGFVVGTAPAFALLGWVLRWMSRTRLAKLAGVAALVAGVWTAGSGISLGGWLSSAASPVAAAFVVPPSSNATETVTVWATRSGYRPGMVSAHAGVPVQIIFKLVDQGCTGTVTIAGRDVALPTTVSLPPQPPGTLRYVCGMGMYTGFIKFS
jgi:sulfite exporter TauE/SafE